ncbi:MAG: hypothetical protein HY397_02890 [Candidatus Doudnabacteria bacterium]|nr:hypothetical protein [Candidatus Doudnabacteria bacterium]
MEIKGDKKSKATKKQAEHEKLAQALVKNLKNTYFSERSVNETTFEKALTNLNNELSSMTKRGLVGWYRRLNGLVAAITKNTLVLSETGQMAAMLLRDGQFHKISENSASAVAPHPLKTFSNFVSGAVAADDLLLFSTVGLFNYISLEKLKRLLDKATLAQASKEIIETLKTDADPADAFAGVIVNLVTKSQLSDEELVPLISPSSHVLLSDQEETNVSTQAKVMAGAGAVLNFVLRWTGKFLQWLLAKLSRRPVSAKTGLPTLAELKNPGWRMTKKRYFYAFILAIVLLIANLIYSNIRNSQKQVRGELQTLLEQTSQNVTDAEAALIYSDENRARAALISAEETLEKLQRAEFAPSETVKLATAVARLSQQLNKIAKIEQIETAATFSKTPDKLIKTPSGFLAFNSFTEAFENFESSTGQVAGLELSRTVPENLATGDFVPQLNAAVFISQTGRFYQLVTSPPALSPLFATSTPIADTGRQMISLKNYESRLYSLDEASDQIWRYPVSVRGIAKEEAWLKEGFSFEQTRDLAIDGNIYVLANQTLIKFTRGQKQNFSAPQLKEGLENATKIFTNQNLDWLYIVDPTHTRVVILNKQGGLVSQLVSERFHELKDIFVDEKNKTMYGIVGNELVKFKF